MSPRRRWSAVAGVAALAAGVAIWAGANSRRLVGSTGELTAGKTHGFPARPEVAQEESARAAEKEMAAGGASASGGPENVSGETQLARQFRAVIAGGQEDLGLTAPEVDRLVDDFMEFQEVNAEVLTQRAIESSHDTESVTVRVPAFAAEGKSLRDLLYRRLATDLSEEKVRRIDDQLGQYIETAFRGFGVAEQVYTVTKSAEHPGAFEVQTQVVVPDEVTTSSANPDVAFGGVSGKVLVTREQLNSGEYRFLGPIVERDFPGR